MALSEDLAEGRGPRKERAEPCRGGGRQDTGAARAGGLLRARVRSGAGRAAARNEAEATGAKVAGRRTDIERSFSEHVAKAREGIDTKRAQHDVKKAKTRAEDAERYAAFAIELRVLGRGGGRVRGARRGARADRRRAGAGGARARGRQRADVMSDHVAAQQHSGPAPFPALRDTARDITGYWWLARRRHRLARHLAGDPPVRFRLRHDGRPPRRPHVRVRRPPDRRPCGVPWGPRWVSAMFGVLFLVSGILCFIEPRATFAAWRTCSASCSSSSASGG